jgi:hypothetical protein
MDTHTCDCKVCQGITFTCPTGRISGTPKQVRDMTHNYAQMLRGPMALPMARKGFTLVK